jgi:hypothetical protein
VAVAEAVYAVPTVAAGRARGLILSGRGEVPVALQVTGEVALGAFAWTGEIGLGQHLDKGSTSMSLRDQLPPVASFAKRWSWLACSLGDDLLSSKGICRDLGQGSITALLLGGLELLNGLASFGCWHCRYRSDCLAQDCWVALIEVA